MTDTGLRAFDGAVAIVWRLFWWLERLSPALSLYQSRKFYEAARKAVEEAEAREASTRG